MSIVHTFLSFATPIPHALICECQARVTAFRGTLRDVHTTPCAPWNAPAAQADRTTDGGFHTPCLVVLSVCCWCVVGGVGLGSDPHLQVKAATLGKEPAWDNPAPYIFANGSAIVMWRGTADSRRGSIALGRAADWRRGPFDAGASTPLFPPYTNFTVPAEPCLSDPAYMKPCAQANIEDPHIWRSRATGHFHALVHNGCDHDCPHVGRHGWSRDGASWTLSRNIAYTAVVEYTDGTTAQSKRRERPHVILSNVTGEPIALITALFARTVNGRNPDPAPRSDYAWTFIQTIEHYTPNGG